MIPSFVTGRKQDQTEMFSAPPAAAPALWLETRFCWSRSLQLVRVLRIGKDDLQRRENCLEATFEDVATVIPARSPSNRESRNLGALPRNARFAEVAASRGFLLVNAVIVTCQLG
jgi:hypothetical protein